MVACIFTRGPPPGAGCAVALTLRSGVGGGRCPVLRSVARVSSRSCCVACVYGRCVARGACASMRAISYSSRAKLPSWKARRRQSHVWGMRSLGQQHVWRRVCAPVFGSRARHLIRPVTGLRPRRGGQTDAKPSTHVARSVDARCTHTRAQSAATPRAANSSSHTPLKRHSSSDSLATAPSRLLPTTPAVDGLTIVTSVGAVAEAALHFQTVAQVS